MCIAGTSFRCFVLLYKTLRQAVNRKVSAEMVICCLRSKWNPACPAGAQEGRQPVVFHPLVDHPFSLRGSDADYRHVTAAKQGERQSGYSCVCFATYSQFTDRLLLHIRATLRRHGICEYNLLHNISCRVRRPRRTVCKFRCRRITVGANNVRPYGVVCTNRWNVLSITVAHII